MSGRDGRSALHVAASQDRGQKDLSAILASGLTVDCWDDYGNTALHVAAEYGAGRAVRGLLALGADANALNFQGRKAGDIAREAGHAAVVKELAADRAKPGGSSGSSGGGGEGSTGDSADSEKGSHASVGSNPWDVDWLRGFGGDEPMTGAAAEKSERWRTSALSEIISSERTYVQELELLSEVYYDGLASLAGDDARALLCVEDVSALFSNVKNIVVFNRRMLTEMEEKSARGESFIGTFRNFVPFLRMYQTYINNYQLASETLQRLKANAAVAKVLKGLDAAAGKSLTLADYLILPVQRVPRYRLLLNEVYKHTPMGTDRVMLAEVLEAISQVASGINSALQKHEARAKVIEVSRECATPDLVTPTRLFLHEGFLDKISRHGPQRRKFVLFSDLLVYMEPIGWGSAERATSYRVNRQLPLASLAVVDHGGSDKDLIILSDEKSFACKAHSKEEKDAWTTKIRDAQRRISSATKEAPAQSDRSSGIHGRRKSLHVMKDGVLRQLELQLGEDLSLATPGKALQVDTFHSNGAGGIGIGAQARKKLVAGVLAASAPDGAAQGDQKPEELLIDLNFAAPTTPQTPQTPQTPNTPNTPNVSQTPHMPHAPTAPPTPVAPQTPVSPAVAWQADAWQAEWPAEWPSAAPPASARPRVSSVRLRPPPPPPPPRRPSVGTVQQVAASLEGLNLQAPGQVQRGQHRQAPPPVPPPVRCPAQQGVSAELPRSPARPPPPPVPRRRASMPSRTPPPLPSVPPPPSQEAAARPRPPPKLSEAFSASSASFDPFATSEEGNRARSFDVRRQAPQPPPRPEHWGKR